LKKSNTHFKKLKITIMGTAITALAIIGFVVLIIGLLRFVHKRDQRLENAKSENEALENNINY
jgi:uncharacterized protein YoxC